MSINAALIGHDQTSVHAPFNAETRRRLSELRSQLGDELLILGHHYMSAEAIRWADLTGDSLALSRLAAKSTAENIVFLGVHFMAETADILTNEDQKVFSPDIGAGCLMAEMASIGQVLQCWNHLVKNNGSRTIPITYVNSSAKLKAFCGEHGGVVCTSSNAEKVMAWALEQGGRALFFPDMHLGRNAAAALGFTGGAVARWVRSDARLLGDADKARVIVWDGFCPVHVGYTVMDVERVRLSNPDIRVIVHPECPREVVEAADDSGSTEKIIKVVEDSPAGAAWAIGTEINLVKRLAGNHPDKVIISLNSNVPQCPDMARINERGLLTTLQGIVEGKPKGVVKVDRQTAQWARKALERMFAVT